RHYPCTVRSNSSLRPSRLGAAVEKYSIDRVLVAGALHPWQLASMRFRKGSVNWVIWKVRTLSLSVIVHQATYDRITALTDDLVRSKANFIVTWAIPVTQVVKDATSTIPVVMAGGRAYGWRIVSFRVLLGVAGNISGPEAVVITTIVEERL